MARRSGRGMERPSALRVYSESWFRARAVFASRPRFYAAWLAAAAINGVLAMFDTRSLTGPGQPYIAAAGLDAAFGWAIMSPIIVYFILADAVRTFVPSFRMTAPVFFIQLVINYAYGIVLEFSALAFIVPAFYIGPKLWLWPPNYLLTGVEKVDIGGSLTHAWQDTNGLYWPTFGLMALVTAAIFVFLLVGIGLGWLLVDLSHPLAVIVSPLVMAAYLIMVAQANCAWLGWSAAVRAHADALLALE